MPGTVKKLQFSEGTDVGAPTDLSLATSTTVIAAFANDAAYITSEGAPMDGSCYFNTTINKFRFYVSGDWRNCLPENDPADPTKLILVDVSGNTTGVSSTLLTANTANRVYTFPDVSLTVAGRINAEELENKTIKNGLLSGGSLDVSAAGNISIGASVGANNLTLGGAASTVVVAGNLQVDGTTTTVNSATLDVTDANVTVNNGGNDASAEGAGLTVERTGTSGTLQYEDALPSHWKIGKAGAEEEVVTTMHVQSIQKKRLRLETVAAANDSTSPRIILPQNTLTNLQTISGGNHPAEGAVYWATDVNRAYVWDGVNLVQIAASPRQYVGRRNYADADGANSTDFEANITGWGTYDDAAAVPVDGTGGTVDYVTISRNTSSPLSQTGDLRIDKSANDAQGEGVVLPFPVPRGYRQGQVSEVSFVLNTQDANFVQGDIKVYLYDVTNSLLITPDNPDLPQDFLGVYKLSWSQNSSASLRLLLHVASTNAAAYSIYLDDVFVGPGESSLIPNVTDWLPYTPVLQGSGSVTTSQTLGQYKIVGDTMMIRTLIEFSSSGSGAGAVGISFPSGYSIDTSKLTNGGSGYENLGSISFYDGTEYVASNPTLSTGDLTGFKIAPESVGYSGFLLYSGIASGAFISANLTIPVAELSGAGIYASTNQVVYVSNNDTWDANSTATSTTYGANGSSIGGTLSADRTKEVKFPRNILSSDMIMIQFSDDGVVWGSNSANSVAVPVLFNATGSTNAGVDWEKLTADTIQINFGRYQNQNTDGSGLTNWTTGYWRVVLSSNPLGIGFNLADANKVGLAPVGVFRANQDGVLDLQDQGVTPSDPDADVETKIYVKSNKFIIQYNDSGTVRYKYLDMTGTGVTWVHTTSAP